METLSENTGGGQSQTGRGILERFFDSSSRSAAVFWICLFAATLPFLVSYMRAMWHQDLYQYFPFLLLGVFGLAYTRYDHTVRFPDRKTVYIPLALCFVFLILAVLMQSSWLGAIGFIFLTVAFLTMLRSRSGRSLAYLSLPMLMFIRAPQLWTYSVMFRLQVLTTKLSSILLDIVGIPHDHSGNTIELATKHLFVAEACSGVQSLFTMCFLSLILLVYRQRSLLLTPVYLVVAVILAVLSNIIRVTTIALAEAWFSLDLAEGWQHELVGYIALLVASGVLLSFDHLIGVLFHPIEAGETASAQNPLIFVWNKVFRGRNEESSNWSQSSRQSDESDAYSQYDAAFDAASKTSKTEFPYVYRLLVGAAVACGLVMLVSKFLTESDRRPIMSKTAVLFEPTEEFLDSLDAPLTIANYRRKRDSEGDINHRLGKHADVWQCGIAGREGEFVLSQPYVGWHELTVCYRVLDWEMRSRRTIDFPQAEEPVVVGTFTKDDLVGYLFFSAIDSDGHIPRTPGYTRGARALAPFWPLIEDDFAEMTGSAQTIMMQYWTVGPREMEAEQVERIAETFEKVRRQTSQAVARQSRELLPDA